MIYILLEKQNVAGLPLIFTLLDSFYDLIYDKPSGSWMEQIFNGLEDSSVNSKMFIEQDNAYWIPYLV